MPLAVVGVGAGLIMVTQRLLSSTKLLAVLLSRAASTVVLMALGAFALAVVAGLVFLWQRSPWIAVFGVAMLLANGSGMWVIWRRGRTDRLD